MIPQSKPAGMPIVWTLAVWESKIDPLWLGEATVDEHSDIIQWADRRARAHTIPKLIQQDWGIDTDQWQKMAIVESGRKAR